MENKEIETKMKGCSGCGSEGLLLLTNNGEWLCERCFYYRGISKHRKAIAKGQRLFNFR